MLLSGAAVCTVISPVHKTVARSTARMNILHGAAEHSLIQTHGMVPFPLLVLPWTVDKNGAFHIDRFYTSGH